MNSNFNPLSPEELVSRINKIPRIRLAQLPTALEYAPNISKELNINLYIKRDDCTASFWREQNKTSRIYNG